MGSFNIACGISQMAIHEDDEMGIVLMQESREHQQDRTKNNQQGITNYVYPEDLYAPYLPPIFGKYGDYGQIIDIEENATTRVLEKIFKRPAEIVLNTIGNHGRNVHSTMGPIYSNYAIRKFADSFGSNPEQYLLSLGFTKIDEETYEYHIEKPHLSYKEKYVYKTDGSMTEIRTVEPTTKMLQLHKNTETTKHASPIKGMEEFHTTIIPASTYFNNTDINDVKTMIDEFSQKTFVYPGYKQEDFGIIAELFKMSGMFFHKKVFTEMNNFLQKTDSTFHKQQADTEHKKIVDFIKTIHNTVQQEKQNTQSNFTLGLLGTSDYFSRESSFPTWLHTHALDEYYTHENDLLLLVEFRGVLSACNALFLPTRIVNSVDELENGLKLNEIATNIMEEKKRKFEEF